MREGDTPNRFGPLLAIFAIVVVVGAAVACRQTAPPRQEGGPPARPRLRPVSSPR